MGRVFEDYEAMLGNKMAVSAYGLAVAAGFRGSLQDWLASLRGETGPKGPAFRYEDFTPEQLELLRGPQGEPGPPGPTDIQVQGIVKGDGSGDVDAAIPGVDYQTPLEEGVDYVTPGILTTKQNLITASGLLQGDGYGNVTAAPLATSEEIDAIIGSLS